MSASTVVNGGTGDYTLEAIAVALVFIVGVPLAAWLEGVILRALERRRHPAVWIQIDPARSPEPCRACGALNGWHDQGCGVLDRLDAVRPVHR